MVHVFSQLEDLSDGLPPMCDMSFEIIEKTYDEGASSWRLCLRADGTPFDPVGFGAIIPIDGWKEQIDGKGDEAFRTFWGPVTLYSRGEESDRLLALMADYYGVPAPPKKRRLLGNLFANKGDASASTWRFAESISCLAVGLSSNPALLTSDVITMKLFFDEGVENGRYAEVFFDIDLCGRLAMLNEKDEEYRPDVIHWLSMPGDVVANPFAIHAD